MEINRSILEPNTLVPMYRLNILLSALPYYIEASSPDGLLSFIYDVGWETKVTFDLIGTLLLFGVFTVPQGILVG